MANLGSNFRGPCGLAQQQRTSALFCRHNRVTFRQPRRSTFRQPHCPAITPPVTVAVVIPSSPPASPRKPCGAPTREKHSTLDPPQRGRDGVQTQCEQGPIRPNGRGDFGPRMYGRSGGAFQPISEANTWARPPPRDRRANEIGGIRPAACRSRHQHRSSRASSGMEPPPHVAPASGDSCAPAVVGTLRALAVVSTLGAPARARPRSRACYC